MALTRSPVFLAQFGAQCGDFLDADGGARVAPRSEDVGQHRGKIFVRQVAEARHHAVVLDAIDRNRAREAEQRGRHDGLAVAEQEIGLRQRRERARQARAVNLVTCGAIRLVDGLAFCHQLSGRCRGDFGIVHRRVAGGRRVSRVL